MADVQAKLEIAVLTPHGQPVTGARVELIGAGVECLGKEAAPGVYQAVLPATGDYYLLVERHDSPGGLDHRTLRTTLFHVQGGEETELLFMRPPEGQRAGVTEIRREGDLYRLRVVLDYLWFSPTGYPPTLGNWVCVLTDGEVGWAAVAEAARGARSSLRLTSWIYEGTTMLERPSPISDPEQREPYTVHRVLESVADAGVKVQLLLWHAPFLGLPNDLLPEARMSGDCFEVMRERNPTRRAIFGGSVGHVVNEILGGFEVGSYHQKTAVVDGRIGFCSGMNLQEHDWDTRLHSLFDPRRCRFSRPKAFRAMVEERLLPADFPPRHDFVARIEGPAVAHIEENFRQRWNHLIEQGEEYSSSATPVDPAVPWDPGQGSSHVQVVRTMPAPFFERGILDVYLRAIGAARRLIYIENQYFRSTHVSSAIADAAAASPDLSVIVVTPERHEDELYSLGWVYECFERIRRRLPGFELYTLRVGAEDAHGARALAEVDTHAKLMIVDDRFLTMGSCNINDRGFEYEGELNVAVVDPDLVRRLRVDLWREHLGQDAGISGDITADVAAWRERAEHNRGIDLEKDSLPVSRVYPFAPKPRKKPIVNPDIF